MGCGGSKPDKADIQAPVTGDLTHEDKQVDQAQVKVEVKGGEGAAAKDVKRRAGVSAEAGAAGGGGAYKKVVHEKSEVAREMIAKATASSTLFLGLGDEQRADVVSACATHLSHPPHAAPRACVRPRSQPGVAPPMQPAACTLWRGALGAPPSVSTRHQHGT